MTTVTLHDFTDRLVDKFGDRVADALDDPTDLTAIHDDYLFDALCDTDPATEADLHDEYDARDDIHTATELAVEHFTRTYTDELRAALPRDTADGYIRATSAALTDELNGLYA